MSMLPLTSIGLREKINNGRKIGKREKKILLEIFDNETESEFLEEKLQEDLREVIDEINIFWISLLIYDRILKRIRKRIIEQRNSSMACRLLNS